VLSVIPPAGFSILTMISFGIALIAGNIAHKKEQRGVMGLVGATAGLVGIVVMLSVTIINLF